MKFLSRLKLYGFGFGLGLMVVYAMFGNRSCTTPNEIKMHELVFQSFELSEKAKCKLKFLRKNEFLLKVELRHFEINYGVSKVHEKPCGQYFVEPKSEHASLYNYKLVLQDCDTITKINDISITSNNTCTCQ